MERKYVLTNETMREKGRILHRIQAVRSFGDIEEGEPGGWIEKESNLSHEGDCWVDDEAMVYDNASVNNNAKIKENAVIKGDVKIMDNSIIRGNAKVMENAIIREDVEVMDDAVIGGHVELKKHVIIGGNSLLIGNSIIDNDDDVRACEIESVINVIFGNI